MIKKYKHYIKGNEEADLIKSIISFNCIKIKEWMRKPDSLILNIQKFGKFYFRKKKVEEKVQFYRANKKTRFLTEYDVNTDMFYLQYIQKEYEKYLEKKKTYRDGNYTREPDTT